MGKKHVLDTITYFNDYSQVYTSPAQITQVNVDKKVKTTQRSEYYFGHQEAVIGDQYDSYHQDGYGNVNTITDATYGDFITNRLYNEYGRSVTPLDTNLVLNKNKNPV